MSNRAAKYEQLHKSLKKHFKPLPEPGERSVLEHLLYACCLEDAKAEQADEAFAKLQQAYFDWNEVRVTTVIELGEALGSLPNPTQAGHRIKRCLQSLFEARYQYDIDDLKKANLSKATEEMTAWKGVSPFILNYVSQNALGGHAIPADNFALDTLVACEILTSAEAEKKTLPGVERAIPKNKGVEFASLLHQFAVEFHQHPKNAAVLAVFKDLGVTPKAKPAEKPAAKKEAALPMDSESSDASAVSSGPKSKSVESPVEASKNAKKADKATEDEKKSKEASSKAAPKTEKVPDAKKKPEPKVENKTAGVKKVESKKPEVKPAPKKEEKPASKDVAKKSSSKDKKAEAPPKSSKPAVDAKKTAPGKKAEAPKSQPAKKVPPPTATKKKPR